MVIRWRARCAVGADGLIVEVHDQPRSFVDGAQALTLEQYQQLIEEVVRFMK